MVDINLDELNKFSDDYHREIDILEENIKLIFDQLLNMNDSINTPIISKKINEFNELYYEVKNSIKNNNLYLDKKIKEIINNYEVLYSSIKGEVNND